MRRVGGLSPAFNVWHLALGAWGLRRRVKLQSRTLAQGHNLGRSGFKLQGLGWGRRSGLQARSRESRVSFRFLFLSCFWCKRWVSGRFGYGLKIELPAFCSVLTYFSMFHLFLFAASFNTLLGFLPLLSVNGVDLFLFYYAFPNFSCLFHFFLHLPKKIGEANSIANRLKLFWSKAITKRCKLRVLNSVIFGKLLYGKQYN